jgi:DNA-binding MarR family transcriptional regulator
MQPSNQISFRIQNVASLLYKASDRILQEKLSIGMSQFKILSAVQYNQRLLQRHIALALNQTEASISRQVKLLHRKKLLVTQLNPTDRRQHITSLTPTGHSLIVNALYILETFQAQFIARLPSEQQAELLKMLEKIETGILSV